MGEDSRLGPPWPARIVAIIPHPDDELWFGGTLALAAAAGSKIRLVCMTHGEAGTDYRPDKLTGARLAAWRAEELAASAALLGVDSVTLWDLPDGELASVPTEVVLARLAPELAAAEVVLVLGVDGIYGHRDHTTTTAWVRMALGRMQGAPAAFGVVFAPGLFDATWSGFAKRRPTLAVPDWIRRGRGTPLGAEAVTVDIRPVEATKRQAIRAHRSQLRGADEAAFFVPGTLVHLLGVERFERLGALGRST